MNEDYLISIWKKYDETHAHHCLEEIYKKQGFQVKNYHKDDRINEKGMDILCKKGNVNIGVSVKKKPRKGDIDQLRRFAKQNPKIKKIYVYLNHPTASFEAEMSKYKNLIYWDWEIFHEELIRNASRRYIILYFSVHPLFSNLYNILKIVYDKHDVKFPKHKVNTSEIKFLWNIKDDSVKVKAILDYVKDKWSLELMNKTQYNPDEYLEYVRKIHTELDIVNSKAGRVFYNTFQRMEREYPYLLAKYWTLISERTKWKEFTAITIELGKLNEDALKKYILHSWVLPDLDDGPYSQVMRNFYSTLNYLLENTYQLAKDLEDGIDWLFTDILKKRL